MRKRIKDFVNRHMIADQDVAVAVSGGPDSLALTHALAQSRVFRNIYALTVDHGLRTGSRREAENVAELTGTWSHVDAHILTWQAERPDTRIQEQARRARYDLMTEFCRKRGVACLFLGHHADDQAETFFFRLSKGSGLGGLAGMRAAREENGVTLCRPFLDLHKAQLETYCEDHGIEFVRDPSNSDRRHMRARLRAAYDALAAEGLSAEHVRSTMQRLARADSALETLTDHAWHKLVRAQTPVEVRFDFGSWCDWPEEIRLRLLARALETCGPERVYPPRLKRLELLEKALNDASGAFPGRSFAGCVIRQNKGVLSVESEKPGNVTGQNA